VSVEKIIRDVSDEIVLHEHLLREVCTDLLLVVTTAPVSTWAFTRLASKPSPLILVNVVSTSFTDTSSKLVDSVENLNVFSFGC
jgi:hypothetical protein